MNVTLQAVLFTALLVYAAVKDVQAREISPYLCIGIACLSLLDFHLENLLGLGIPVILWACAVWICPDQLGGGDIKITAAVSILMGFTATAYGIIIAFTLELLRFQKIKRELTEQEARNFTMPLVPFLAVGFFITYFMKMGGLII